MVKTGTRKVFRRKLILIALAALAGGVLLLSLSLYVAPSGEETQATAGAPSDELPQPAREQSAQNLSGLILLFGLALFALTVICIGWLVIEIYNARPAWKTQTKFPKKR